MTVLARVCRLEWPCETCSVVVMLAGCNLIAKGPDKKLPSAQ